MSEFAAVSGATLKWSSDFVLLDGRALTGLAFAQLRASTQSWVVISRDRGTHLYAFKRDEVLDHANLRRLLDRGVDVNATPLEIALDLHEWQESTRTRGEAAPPEDVWRNAAANGTPSSKRLIAVNEAGTAQAVGWDDVREHREPSVVMPQPAATQEHAGNMADLPRPQIAMPTRVEEERAELSTGHEYREYQ